MQVREREEPRDRERVSETNGVTISRAAADAIRVALPQSWPSNLQGGTTAVEDPLLPCHFTTLLLFTFPLPHLPFFAAANNNQVAA